MRIKSFGHAAFALILIWLGVLGLIKGTFGQMWQPVPKWVPAQTALAYLCAVISLGSGVALLFPRTAAVASRVLFAALMAWLLVMRFPYLFFQKPLVLVAWSFGATAVMVAGAWVLYVWLASERDRSRLGFVADDRGLRIASALYGVSLIPFGLAHFLYMEATAPLIPDWLPWHVGLAYFTGAAFIAAGLSAITGVAARLGVALSALQMALFGLIVWIPRVLSGNLSEFQRGEAIQTWVLTAGAWIVADSLRDKSWLGLRKGASA